MIPLVGARGGESPVLTGVAYVIEEVLARIVSQHHGMVFDFEQDGQCVLDCTGRRLLHLQVAGEETRLGGYHRETEGVL